MVLQRSAVTFRFEMRSTFIMQCDLTPNTMQSCQALVTFNRFVALITLGWAVTFNPVVMHDISVLLGLHISLDARRRCSSHTALMDRILAKGTAEALLPHTDQHVQAKIAVGRFVKVLESPHMLSIILHVIFQAQKHKKWNCCHSSLDPFLQRDRPIMIIVNFFHHFVEDWIKFSDIPFKVFCDMHHLTDDIF